MSRVHIHMEKKAHQEVTVLHVNGQELHMTDTELETLLCDVLWARDRIRINQRQQCKCYEENQNVA